MAPVIVTRPEREALPWVQALRSAGVDAVALPLIAIGPSTSPAAQAALRQAQQAWSSYRAVMFVSGNAVVHFFEQNRPQALINQRPSAIKTRFWSPGPGTAHALAQAGVAPADIDGPAADAAQFDSEALWQQVAPQIGPGDRVLIVRGGDAGGPAPAHGAGRDWLARQIEAAGGQVDFVAAYERGAPVFSAAEVARAQQAASDGSIWLLSSSQAISHLTQRLPTQDWRAARALATHPRIALAARQAGFGRVDSCRPAMADVIASIESTP